MNFVNEVRKPVICLASKDRDCRKGWNCATWASMKIMAGFVLFFIGCYLVLVSVLLGGRLGGRRSRGGGDKTVPLFGLCGWVFELAEGG